MSYDFINNKAIGIDQVWTSFTGSKGVNTTYTNTSGRPIRVTITADTSTNTDLLVDGNSVITINTPNLIIYDTIVPNDSEYRLQGGSSIVKWMELI